MGKIDLILTQMRLMNLGDHQSSGCFVRKQGDHPDKIGLLIRVLPGFKKASVLYPNNIHQHYTISLDEISLIEDTDAQMILVQNKSTDYEKLLKERKKLRMNLRANGEIPVTEFEIGDIVTSSLIERWFCRKDLTGLIYQLEPEKETALVYLPTMLVIIRIKTCELSSISLSKLSFKKTLIKRTIQTIASGNSLILDSKIPVEIDRHALDNRQKKGIFYASDYQGSKNSCVPKWKVAPSTYFSPEEETPGEATQTMSGGSLLGPTTSIPSWSKLNSTLAWKTFIDLVNRGELTTEDCCQCYKSFLNLQLNLEQGSYADIRDGDYEDITQKLDQILATGLSLDENFLQRIII